MTDYRRAFVAGATWFFTVNLLVDHIGALRQAVRKTRRRFPFEIDAMVVLPDHLHAVWTLPGRRLRFPGALAPRQDPLLPGGSERRMARRSRQARRERGIWQPRYWEHMIRDERDYARHIDYCWFNPVKHGLVANVEDWPFSLFHRDNRGTPSPGDLAAFETRLAECAASSRSHA